MPHFWHFHLSRSSTFSRVQAGSNVTPNTLQRFLSDVASENEDARFVSADVDFFLGLFSPHL
jgi:hypothetical protein